MILRISIPNVVTVTMDDGTKHRPVPEVVDDYLTRLRHQAQAVYADLPDTVDTGSHDAEA